MKKKGFTLIELLAVIVILAIIAPIATPLVLKYIEKSRSESKVDSVYSFVRNLETEIANFSIKNNGKKYTTDKENIKELGLDITVKGENPDDGKVCISKLGQIENGIFQYDDYYVNYDGKKASISDKENYDSFSCGDNFSVCTLAQGGDADNSNSITPGDIYLCKVKENMETEYQDGYTFYVLSTNVDGTTNLIMDQNIYSDGTPAGVNGVEYSDNPSKYSLVAWNSESGDEYNKNTYGPVTAMKFLHNATKNWKKVEPINYEYKDNLLQGGNYGYTSFISNNGVAKITTLSGNEIEIANQNEPLRARMPVYLKDSSDSELAAKNTTNEFLYVNLPIYGYWTISSATKDASSVWALYVFGVLGEYGGASLSSDLGIRPVINVKL